MARSAVGIVFIKGKNKKVLEVASSVVWLTADAQKECDVAFQNPRPIIADHQLCDNRLYQSEFVWNKHHHVNCNKNANVIKFINIKNIFCVDIESFINKKYVGLIQVPEIS